MSVGSEKAKSRVLFVCIENSSRSVMAAAFANRLGFDATSAGTLPSTHVNPLVVEVMEEIGIDVSESRPRGLTETMIEGSDLVVLTDASLEEAIPGNFRRKMRKKVVAWSIPDPQGKIVEEVRFIRDMIKDRVEELADEPRLRKPQH